MSDADLALFKQSLPRVINTPGGNELILQTLRGIAEYDMQAGQIAQRLASGEIDVPTYLRDMASLKNPIPPVMRQQAPSPSMSADDAANTLLGK
jgi:flagellar protein FlgJ